MQDDSPDLAAIIRRLQALEQHRLDATPQATPDVNDARALAVQRLIDLRPVLDRLVHHDASSPDAETFDIQALIAFVRSLYPDHRPEDDDDARLMFETVRAVMIHLVEVKLAGEMPVPGDDQTGKSGQIPTAKMAQQHYEWNLVVANILEALELHLDITNEKDEKGQAVINQPYRKMIGEIWLGALANLLRTPANRLHPLVQSAGMDTMCELISKHRPNKNALLKLLSAQGLSEMIRASRDGHCSVSLFELAYRLLPVGKKERFAYIETLTSGKEFGGPEGGMQADLLDFNGGNYYELRDKWLPIIAAGSYERAQPFEISTLVLDEQVLVTPDSSRFFWIAQDFLETEFEPALDDAEPSPGSAPKDRKLYVSLESVHAIDVDVTSEPGMLVLTVSLSRAPDIDMPPTEFTEEDEAFGSHVLIVRLKRFQEVVDRLRRTFADRGGRYPMFNAGLIPDSNHRPKAMRASRSAVRVSRTAAIEAPMGKSDATEAEDPPESLGVESKMEESDPIESFDSRKVRSQARAEQVRKMAELPQPEHEGLKNDSGPATPLQKDDEFEEHSGAAPVEEQAPDEGGIGGLAEAAQVEPETQAPSTEVGEGRTDASGKAPALDTRKSSQEFVEHKAVARRKASTTKETLQGTKPTTRSSDGSLVRKDQKIAASTRAGGTRAAAKRSGPPSPSPVNEGGDESEEDDRFAEQDTTAKTPPGPVERDDGQPVKKQRVEVKIPVGRFGSQGATDVSDEEHETLSPPRPLKSTPKKQYGQPKNKIKVMEKAERPLKRNRGSSIVQQGDEQAQSVIEVLVSAEKSASSLSSPLNDPAEDSDDVAAQIVTLPRKAGAPAGSRRVVASKGVTKRVGVKSPFEGQSEQKIGKDGVGLETGRTSKTKQVKDHLDESTDDDDTTDYEEARPKKRQPLKAQQLKAMQLPSPSKAVSKKKKAVADVVASKGKGSSTAVVSTAQPALRRASPRNSKKTKNVPEEEQGDHSSLTEVEKYSGAGKERSVAAKSQARQHDIGVPHVVDQLESEGMGGMEHDLVPDQEEMSYRHAPLTESIAVAPVREATADLLSVQADPLARARSTESTMLDPAVDSQFVTNALADDISAADGMSSKILEASEPHEGEPVAQLPLDEESSTKSRLQGNAAAHLERVVHQDESSDLYVGSPSPSPLKLGDHVLGQTPQQTWQEHMFYDAAEDLAICQDNDGGMRTGSVKLTEDERVKAKMAIPDALVESDQEDGAESLCQPDHFALSGEPNDEKIQHRVPSPLTVATLPQFRFGPPSVDRTNFTRSAKAAQSERDRHRKLERTWKTPSHDPFFSVTGASSRIKPFDHRKRAKKVAVRGNKPTIPTSKSIAGPRAAARNVRASSAPPESSSPLPEISKDGRSKKIRHEPAAAPGNASKRTSADQQRSSVIHDQLHGVVEVILETHKNRCEFQLERLTAAQEAIKVYGWECSLPILQNTHRIAYAVERVHDFTLVRRNALREKMHEMEKTGAQVVADLV
ncbi:BQ2448_8108 [Microbotryum intermedium]|uniref:BQ2448_8108 protein n=1 Tax=Microbotryum intermedium TaxID=269621 RepID=A0A238FNW0_9BASI|nr:BQ2448_8108 [Microbotryum intermedium]